MFAGVEGFVHPSIVGRNTLLWSQMYKLNFFAKRQWITNGYVLLLVTRTRCHLSPQFLQRGTIPRIRVAVAAALSQILQSRLVPRPSKRPRNDLTNDPPDELVVAYMTSVQHAMVECDKDWTPYMAGRHFQSSCGARLDPDRTTMSREANSALALCQRPACMRVWKALLL